MNTYPKRRHSSDRQQCPTCHFTAEHGRKIHRREKEDVMQKNIYLNGSELSKLNSPAFSLRRFLGIASAVKKNSG